MAKLTLSVDDHVIEGAKLHAKRHHLSVSEMVEIYLAAVADPPPSPIPDGPILRALRGSLKHGDRETYRKHLIEKYR